MIVFFAALLAMLVGAEIFLRYSTISIVKICALTLLAIGSIALGWPTVSRGTQVIRASVVVVFGLFMVYETLRFPGILKETQVYPVSAIIKFFLETVIFLGVSVFVAVPTLKKALIRLTGKR